MHIGVDLLSSGSVQGIEIFAINILNALAAEYPDAKITVFAKKDFVEFFSSRYEVSASVSFFSFTLFNSKMGSVFLQQFVLPVFIWKERVDILWSPSPFAPWLSSAPVIVTIHDAAYVRFPEFRNIFSSIYIRVSIFLTRFFRRRVCTVSEFSKQELISLYKFYPDDITVTVNGLPKINPATNAAVPGGVRKPYFLYIGVIRPRKNIERLLRAFAARDLKIKNYQLVLAGGVDDTFLNVSNLVESLGLSGQVLQTGFVSEAEKAGLMKEASALVFPSLYEGFGLPVLEAQSFGLPVLTSHGSSLVEVSGGGALFCDPESIGDIAGKLASIALDVNLRERLIDGGYKNLERFSWQRTARKLMTLFQSVSH